MNLKRLLHDDGGQTMVLTALALTSLLGMAAFSVDVGVMFNAKRVLQTAADAGAIAGASEYSYSDVTAAAKAATTQNGMTDGSNGVTITVNNPPSSGSHAVGGANASSSAVEVIASRAVPTIFMKVFGLSTMTVTARAVAAFGPASSCIYALDTSGVDVGMNGNGDLNMPDCGVLINSSSSNALDMVGNTTLTAKSIGIVGNYNTNGGETPKPITGVLPVSNPLAYLKAPDFTVTSCLADPSPKNAVTLGPATAGGTVCYNGLSMTSHAAVWLNPGVYVINGALSMAGQASISGTGVTIYLAPPNGSLSLTGGSSIDIIAPNDKSNPYNGIAIFQAPSDTNDMTVNGNSGSTLEGIIYAPSATLSFSGTSDATIYADLVVGSLTMSGTPTVMNYSGINKNEPLVSARLVE
jgi:Flp pilus assembly protein TadG